MEKEPFNFSYTEPTLDWYRDVHVEIKWEDYLYFKVERRFGPSWWLIGYQKEDGRFEHRAVTLGSMNEGCLRKFIKWCEFPDATNRTCSKLIEISAISTGFNLMQEIEKLRDER